MFFREPCDICELNIYLKNSKAAIVDNQCTFLSGRKIKSSLKWKRRDLRGRVEKEESVFVFVFCLLSVSALFLSEIVRQLPKNECFLSKVDCLRLARSTANISEVFYCFI